MQVGDAKTQAMQVVQELQKQAASAEQMKATAYEFFEKAKELSPAPVETPAGPSGGAPVSPPVETPEETPVEKPVKPVVTTPEETPDETPVVETPEETPKEEPKVESPKPDTGAQAGAGGTESSARNAAGTCTMAMLMLMLSQLNA